jgi:hypothetical protein
MSILSIFDKPKPFDVPAFVESWTDAPRFLGKKKVDPPVATWLDAVRAGCVERKVPEKHHVAVARALLGDKALARLQEFELVLASMKGGEYKWDWDKFKLAMTNMGCESSVVRSMLTPILIGCHFQRGDFEEEDLAIHRRGQALWTVVGYWQERRLVYG